jgi:subtilisin family serine protease
MLRKKGAPEGVVVSFLFQWSARLVLAVVMVLWSISAFAGDKVVDPSRLLSKIQQNGAVRVLIKVKTPGYEGLANSSQRYKVLAPNEVAAPQQRDADKNLASAINLAADTALAGVPTSSVKRLHTFSTIPFVAASVTREGLDALYNNENVLLVQEDKLYPPGEIIKSEGDPTPPNINSNLTQIGATSAWAQGYTGSGWYVAILDTGIRRTHEFFSGKTIVEGCFSSKYEGYNPNGTLCPNGTNEMYGTGAAAHYSTDASWHGTHVAGIAAGYKSDGTVGGVAKDAGVIAVQVFSDGFVGYSSTILSYGSDQIRGLEYLYSIRGQYSIAAANMSLGSDGYSSACDEEAIKAIIDNLRSVGIATVISSGNDSYCSAVGSPGCVSTAVTVGAVNSSDGTASFSNWQVGMVDVFAPGVSIYSSIGSSDTDYANYSGTSMAAPHVAGAWVLAKQRLNSAGVSQIQSAFTSTAKTVTFGTCTTPSNTSLRIQVNDAIAQLITTASTQADLLWRNVSDGRVGVWYYDGVSRLGWSILGSVANMWTIGGLGDYNSDGKKDILWRSPSTGQNVVWYMSGGARTGWAYLDSVAGAWTIVGGGDFNADGKDDILWRNTANGKNLVWYMNGITRTDYANLQSASANWSVVGVGDFNSDGKPDILWRDAGRGKNVVWFMDGVTLGSYVFLSDVDSSWVVGGVGDFNGDLKPDILWRKPSTGRNTVWYMNGTTYTGYANITNVDSSWDAKGVGPLH